MLGSYPDIMIEAPVLFIQNKIYYICSLLDSTMVDCSSLSYGTRKYFMSIDFDVMNMDNSTYLLMLEDGLGIFIVGSPRDPETNYTRWITPAELQNLSIVAPFTYTSIVDYKFGYLTVELGTTYESYELRIPVDTINGSGQLQVIRHYMKYLDCEYNRESQPMYYGELVLKTCSTKQQTNFLLAGAFPVYQSPPKKYVMVFLRQEKSWPISMYDVQLSQDFSISGQYVVVNSRANLLCYYRIKVSPNQSLSWRIRQVDTPPTDPDSSCNLTVQFFNDYYQANYTVELKYEAGTVGEVRQPIEMRVFVGLIVLVSGVFMWKELRDQKRHDKPTKFRKRKSTSKRIDFFSNEFENNLKKVRSMRI